MQRAKVYASILSTGKLDAWQGATAAKAGWEAAVEAQRAGETAFRGEADAIGALAAMAPHLSGLLLEKARDAVRRIGYSKYKADGLMALAPQFAEPERTAVLREALETARQISAPYFKTDALIALAGKVPGASEDAIVAVTSEGPDFLRLGPLIKLAGRLPEPQKGEFAQRAYQMIQNVEADTAADEMGKLLGILQSPLRETAAHEFLARAMTMPIEDREGGLPRSTALIGIAPYLSEDDLERAIACGRSIPGYPGIASIRASVLCALSRSTKGAAKAGLIQEALRLIRAEPYRPIRTESLIDAIDYLEEGDRERVTGEALADSLELWDRGLNYGDPSPRLVMLGKLAPYLNSAQVAEALRGALTIKDAEQESIALVSLAKGLAGAPRMAAQSAALDAAWSLRENPMAIFPITEILKGMGEELVPRAFEMVMAIPRKTPGVADWEIAMRALAPSLPSGLAARAVATVPELDMPHDRAEVLAALVPQLEGEARDRAIVATIAAVREIRYPHLRASALRKLAPSLDQLGIADVWELLDTLEEDRYRDEVFVPLAARLRGELLLLALERARTLKPYDRVRALCGMAPHLDAGERAAALREAYRTTAGMKVGETYGEQAALTLAPHLEGKSKRTILKKGLAQVRAIANHEMGAPLLADFAGLLEGKERAAVLRDGFALATRIEESKTRGETMARLIALMDAALREECLAAARKIAERRKRLEVLAALLPWLPDNDAAVAEARGLLREYLQEMGMQKRLALLEFMDQPAVFAPPLLTPDAIGAAASSIIEICGRWRWA